MGLFDIEDVDDIMNDDFVEESKNPYLSNSQQALRLLTKILSISRDSYYKMKEIQRMNDMLDEELLGSLKKVRLNNEAQLQLKLVQLSDKLREQKKYQILKNKPIVGIGGKFSAGKSKFINSILKAGEDLLPEGQNPTTSIPTYIAYGKKEEINAYTEDNRQVSLDILSMQALTHEFYEKYGMGFSSFIDSLFIMEPDMPYHNLIFLDTPGYSKADLGVGNRLQKNLTDESKAYEQLKNIDYLIWLIDIENGEMSEKDISFISRLHINTPILIVLNKADKKIDEEISEIIGRIENTVRDNGLKSYAITAYSSRNHKEWNQRGKIQNFLSEAMKGKINESGDLLKQISKIDKDISYEINHKIDQKIEERNTLSMVVFQSDDFMEIKTLISIYAETMETIRDLRECKKIHRRNIGKLQKILDKHYGEERPDGRKL